MKAIGFIPVHLDSQRVPRKPLLLIGKQTILERTYRQAKKAKSLDEVYIVSDEEEIFSEAKKFGGLVIKNPSFASCGTERIAQVVQDFPSEIIVNIQGDEPFISEQMIDELVKRMEVEYPDVITPVVKIKDEEEIFNPDVVKCVFDFNNFALYFSRASIPYCQTQDYFFKHIGVYVYQKKILQQFLKIKPGILEKKEKLEQLRFLENGYRIKIMISQDDSLGINSFKDLEKAHLQVEEKK